MPRSGVRRIIVVGLAVVAAGLLAGGVVAARSAFPGDGAELDRALRSGSLEEIADIPAAPGAPRRAVYVQQSSGLVCLWDAPSATALTRQGACNPESDPLAGSALFVSFSYDGGPAAADVTDARLIGLASSEAARVDVVLTDGSRQRVALRPVRLEAGAYRAFGYRLRRSDLRRGVGPAAVVALDAGGRELDRQETGI